MADLQIIVFSLNNEICGADTSQVYKIIKYEEITRIPKMPDFIEGIINLRGRVVPVINLNRRFELGAAEITKKTKIIITEIDKNQVGFMVNDVSEILKLTEDEFESTPEAIKKFGNDYLTCVGKKNQQLIAVLNLKDILNGHELDQIDNTNLEGKIENQNIEIEPSQF